MSTLGVTGLKLFDLHRGESLPASEVDDLAARGLVRVISVAEHGMIARYEALQDHIEELDVCR